MAFRLAPTALLLFAALALGGAASAHLLGDPNSSSQLRVDAGIGLHAEIDVTLDLAGEPDPPGRITIYVPRGFQIYPSRPAGSTVGTCPSITRPLVLVPSFAAPSMLSQSLGP